MLALQGMHCSAGADKGNMLVNASLCSKMLVHLSQGLSLRDSSPGVCFHVQVLQQACLAVKSLRLRFDSAATNEHFAEFLHVCQ